MRILFVADGRSPIALNWISYFVAGGHQVHLVSTYPCAPAVGVASLHVIAPFWVSNQVLQAASQKQSSHAYQKTRSGFSLPVNLRTTLRQWLAPLKIGKCARQLEKVVNEIRPDLIHAMRIPYEGMITSQLQAHIPLVVSVWGNDFTLHAKATPILAHYTRLTLQRLDVLHTDCLRDQRLAKLWGFSEAKQSIVLPGAGGVQLDIFHPDRKKNSANTTCRRPMIINPRGFRAYVRNDTVFEAIPKVVQAYPNARFLCPAMQDEPRAHSWLKKFASDANVELLPHQTRLQMAHLFQLSDITLSITTHDGTPNTLLEAMACGCFPIAGNIETLREWITSGENGYLVSPDDSSALANAILSAIDDRELRGKAEQINYKLVEDKADYKKVMKKAEALYLSII